MSNALQIRSMEPADWPAVWQLLQPVFRADETFPHDPAITEAEARAAWVEQSQAVMVAVDGDGALVSTNTAGNRHQQLGYVDALVMIQSLVEGPGP